jgi:PKD repeat protein
VNAPVAAFDASPDSLCLGDPFTFTDASLAVPDPATNWFWAFDDGTFSLLQNPTHTYSAPGTYNVMMVASNSGGNDTAFFTVKVLALPCLLPPSIQLNATSLEEKVLLNWDVSLGIPYDQFEVLRSSDGSNFQVIGNEPERPGTSRYGYLDLGPSLQSNNYYRIQSRSTNGELQYSNVVLVNLAHAGGTDLSIYPNPLSDGNLLHISLLSEQEGNLDWGLFDMLGRKLAAGELGLMVGENEMELDLGAIAKGSYLIRLQYGGKAVHQKLIIE